MESLCKSPHIHNPERNHVNGQCKKCMWIVSEGCGDVEYLLKVKKMKRFIPLSNQKILEKEIPYTTLRKRLNNPSQYLLPPPGPRATPYELWEAANVK